MHILFDGCPHPKLRRAKNKAFVKILEKNVENMGNKRELVLPCVSVVCPEGGLAAGPWDLSHSSYTGRTLILFSFKQCWAASMIASYQEKIITLIIVISSRW